MNKFLRKINFNRPKIRSYSMNSHKNRGKVFYHKLLKQLALCIVLVLLVILIKNINTTITNKTSEIIKTSLTKEINLKKSAEAIIKYAKEIPKIPSKAVNVFNVFEKKGEHTIDFIAPLQGEIISTYGERTDPLLNSNNFQRGVDILASEGSEIVSIGDGIVEEIGESNNFGKYIKIGHDNQFFSFYGNCSIIHVKKGQKIKQGDIIGQISNEASKEKLYLHLELWKEGEIVDPMQYIRFDKWIL